MRPQQILSSDLAAAVSQHPAVRGCFVTRRDDLKGGTVWLAYVSMDPTAVTPYEEMLDELRQRFGTGLPLLFVRLDNLSLPGQPSQRAA